MQFQSPLAILDRMYEDIDLGLAFRDVVIRLMVVFWLSLVIMSFKTSKAVLKDRNIIKYIS